MSRRNVLLIVVDQWRGEMLPKLGAKFLRTPNIDRLSAEGVTFRHHFTQAVPCGPGRASLLTGLYQMNHRAVQNTVPLDSRHDNLGKMLRRAGYDPALVGYTTTTPDPRGTTTDDPRFRVLGDVMDGFRPVGAFEPYMEAYFAWLLASGLDVPEPQAFEAIQARGVKATVEGRVVLVGNPALLDIAHTVQTKLKAVISAL